MSTTNMTRRSFTKVAAAVGAALAATESVQLLEDADKAFAAQSVERVMHKTACHGCTNCCPVRVYTEDGKVVKIEGESRWTAEQGRCVPEVPEPDSDIVQPSPCAASHEARGGTRPEQVGSHQLG